jgi:hypothetical protein
MESKGIHDAIVSIIYNTLKSQTRDCLTDPEKQVFYFSHLCIEGEEIAVMPEDCIVLVEVTENMIDKDRAKMRKAGFAENEITEMKNSIKTLNEERIRLGELQRGQFMDAEWAWRFSKPDRWPCCYYKESACHYIYQYEDFFFSLFIEKKSKIPHAIILMTYLSCCARMMIRCIQFEREANIYFNIKEYKDKEVYHLMILIK